MDPDRIDSDGDELSAEEEAALKAMQSEGEEEEAPETEEEGEEGADGEKRDDRRQKTVPHGAFHEERERRKAAENELTQIRERTARLEERWNMMLQRAQLQQQHQKEAEPPDPEKDIFGYARWLADQNKSLSQRVEQAHQVTQQQLVAQQIETAARADGARFARQQPDFADAYRYLYELRTAQYRALGYPEQHIAMALRQEELQTAAMAMQAGVSPAERFYQLAIASGYRPQKPEKTGGEAKQKLERVSAAQKANKSLSSAGGSGVNAGAITVEDLLKMDDDEFARFSEKNAKKLRELMGG